MHLHRVWKIFCRVGSDRHYLDAVIGEEDVLIRSGQNAEGPVRVLPVAAGDVGPAIGLGKGSCLQTEEKSGRSDTQYSDSDSHNSPSGKHPHAIEALWKVSGFAIGDGNRAG